MACLLNWIGKYDDFLSDIDKQSFSFACLYKAFFSEKKIMHAVGAVFKPGPDRVLQITGVGGQVKDSG